MRSGGEEGIRRGEKVRKRERGKLKSFELTLTIRTEFMVQTRFLNFDLYLG